MPQRPRLTPEVADVRRAIRDLFAEPELDGVKKVLLAVSGGADSMALAAGCAFELPKLGISISAVVVDHGLQPGSEKVATEAKSRLSELGIESQVVRVKVSNKGDGLEAAARTARYQALEDLARESGAERILLGHNLDDQAETVLLGLTRGSGLKSISGMRKIDDVYLRPLIELSKSDLRKACQDQGIEFWDDPHNEDPRFTRVRIRKLMQTIEQELGPGVASALARTAELASEAETVVQAQATELIQSAETTAGLQVKKLLDAPAGVRRKALVVWLQEQGAKSPTRTQVLAVEELITNWHGQKPASLSGITVERVAQELKASKSR